MRLGSGTDFATLTFQRMSGTRALGHGRLRIEFMAHVREQPEHSVRLSDFSGELCLREATGGIVPVARLAPMSPPLCIDSHKNSNTMSFVLEAELDRYRLEAIERTRRGGELHWNLTVRAQAAYKEQVQTVGDAETIDLNKGVWLEILAQLGYRETLLLEIPLTGVTGKHAAKALKYLRAAHHAFLQGEDRDAVAQCREALEALSSLGGSDKDATFENSRTLSKQDRLLVLRRALKLLPHAAKHADLNEQPIEWERADAEMMISMTAALIRRYTPS